MANTVNCTSDPSNNQTCPLGCICDEYGNRASCLEIQERWQTLFSLGEFFDGIYCPEVEKLEYPTYGSSIQFCPQGSYCPNPIDIKPCPKGKFCPVKTKEPQIECSACKEGATKLSPPKWGIGILVVIIALVLAFIIYRIVVACSNRRADENDKKEELKEIAQDTQNEEHLKKLERQRVKKLAPKLKMIYERLGLEWTDPDDKNVNNADLLDTEKLMNAIDVDSDNVVTYEELNVALRLQENQLKKFIKIMNQLGGRPLDCPTVDGDTFINYFLDAMERAANFDPSPEEAAKIFEDIAQRQTGDTEANEIDLNGLVDTDLMFFLSYPQIISIIQGLKSVYALHGRVEGSEGLRRSSVKWRPGVVGTSETIVIDKETFVEHYPIVLHQATLGKNDDIGLGVDIAFEDLSLHITVGGKSTAIVDTVTGRLQKKTMTAIMGGSGAGKTSLLNALCGRAFYGEVTGDIFVNGHKTHIDKYKDHVGFVPQDDIVYAELTVKENLIFAGRFSLPNGTRNHEIEDLADEVMANLGLTRIADNIVGDVTRRGVSGGEKKRVNIGLELMSKPSILFLDEPTSGLDSNSAMLVMSGLRSLVQKKGVTICTVIHQPRKTIFELFDCLILLGVGGKMVYTGPIEDAEDYFEKLGYEIPAGESVADYFIDISSGRTNPNLRNMASKRNMFSGKQSAIGRPPELEQLELVATPIDEENEANKAKRNRFKLYQDWIDYFNLLDEEEKEKYEVPVQFGLPESRMKQSFFVQLWYHMLRNFIVQGRNITSKVITTAIILILVIILCLMQGMLKLSLEENTQPKFRDQFQLFTSNDMDYFDDFFSDKDEVDVFISHIFHNVAKTYNNITSFALMMGLATAWLICLNTSTVLSSKKLELNREAGSGYNLNAFYLSLNITSSIEVLVQIVLISFLCWLLRMSATSDIVVNFILLGWIASAWALLYPIIIPTKNVTIVITVAVFFFGLMFGTQVPPCDLKGVYKYDIVKFLAGFLNPIRFYYETMLVSELRTLPPQDSFTFQDPNDDFLNNLPYNFYQVANGLNRNGVAQDYMPEVSEQTHSAWARLMIPAFLVGLTIRSLGFLMLHIVGRAEQARTPFFRDLKNCSCIIQTLVLLSIFLLFFMLSLWQMNIF